MKKVLSLVLALIMILSVGTIGVSAYESSDYMWVSTSRYGAKIDDYLYFPVFYDNDQGYARYVDENSKTKITFPFFYDPEILKPIDVTPSELLYDMNFTGEISAIDVYTYIGKSGKEISYPYFYVEITFNGGAEIGKDDILFNVKLELIGEATPNNGGYIFDSYFIVEDLENSVRTCAKWEITADDGNIIDLSSQIQHNYRLYPDDTDDNLTLNSYVPFIPPVDCDITEVTYIQQEDTHKDFTVTANGRKSMIQFIEPDGGTRTYDRYNKNVKITSYNADDKVVNAMARDLAYEVWEIYSNMSVGVEIKARVKESGKWNAEKYSFTIEPYNPIISMELSLTSGAKGAIPATVVADEKTEKVMLKMPDGSSATISTFTTDENGNCVFNGKAWMNEYGLNEIKVYIRRNNVWKLAGVFEYTVE